MYLPRKIDQELSAWRKEKEGKPLLIRGARQVGKSTAIRELSKQFDSFLEVNFEEQRLLIFSINESVCLYQPGGCTGFLY
jgi:predicted AAA+ superfamily ATPase